MLRQSTQLTSNSTAASITLSVPITFIFTASMGVKLARRHLLESGRVKHEVDAAHCAADAVTIAHIADVELQPVADVPPAQVILLLFISTEDAYLPEV